MSNKRSRKRSRDLGRNRVSANPAGTMFNPNVPVQDEFSWSYDAIKTYLQENVALLRPQVANTEMAHLFRFGVTAHSAASYRAEALRQVKFALGTEDGTPLDPASPMANSEHALAIKRAFGNNFANVIERSELSYCFYGASLLRRVYTQSGMLDSFQWINNNFFQTDADPWGGLKGFRVRSIWGSELEPDITYIQPQNSVYLHNVDFFDDFGGLGPVQVAYTQAATETEIAATQLQFFRNMAMPSFAMQPASGESYRPGKDQKDELTELMRRMYQGSQNAGRSLVLPTRWDIIRFQQDFDKLGMPELTQEARDAVIRTMRVPLELLDPRQTSTGSSAKFYERRREWLISWLVPQAERYADIFTEQIAKPINPNWRIIPIFTKVQGITEDVSSRTETVRKQVSDGLLSMGKAQVILGYEADPNVEDLYMIQGVPVPGPELKNYWRFAPGNPGKVSAEDTAPLKRPEVAPVSSSAAVTTHDSEAGQSSEKSVDGGRKTIPFLPDAAYKELRAWNHVVERKGRNYAFEAKALPSDAVAYGRLLLITSDGPLQDTWATIHTYAAKDFDQTERSYRTNLYLLMVDSFDEKLSRGEFGAAGRLEITNAFYSAFKNGLQEAGVDPSEMAEEEKDYLRLETKMERSYWTALADDMFRTVIPLKGQPGYEAARDKMLGRIELWVSKGLHRMHESGKIYGNMNGMKLWEYAGEKDHCASCEAADGQIHRARNWLRVIIPRSDACICGGYRCGCGLTDTDEYARGALTSIPLSAGKAMDSAPAASDVYADTSEDDENVVEVAI